MSALAMIQSMTLQSSRSPFTTYMKGQGAGATASAGRESRPVQDSVDISPEAQHRQTAQEALQKTSQVLAPSHQSSFSAYA